MQTIHELIAQGGFGVAQPLFAEATYDAAHVDAVFEGRQPGRVFVDDPTRPTVALLCRTYEYYLAGDSGGPGGRALRQFLRDAPAEPGVFADLYGYVGLAPAWEAALLVDHGTALEVIERRAFDYDTAVGRQALARLQFPPPGVRIVPIDRALAERIDDELQEGIARFWSGYDRFVAGGFGSCALVGDELGGVAVAIAVSAREANIGVVTAPVHRRRGLATLACAAFVRDCLDRGLTPTWDCDAANVASLATARRVGFRGERRFAELAPPGRSRLALSHGLWRGEDVAGGSTIVWRLSAT